MRKQFLALATLALSVNALAASTTTLTTSTKKLSLGKFLDSTKVSLYSNAEKTDAKNGVTSHYESLIINNTINSEFSTSLWIRSQFNDVDAPAGKQGRDLTMIDPRFFLYGYKRTLKTSIGDITLSPRIRTQIAINDASKDRYATLRPGVVASMNTNSFNNVSAYVGVYETVTKKNAARSVHEGSNIYYWVADTYTINDHHSFSAYYEIFANLNQDTLAYSDPVANNDFSIYYNNNSFKNLALSAYIGQNMGQKFALDMALVGASATYSF